MYSWEPFSHICFKPCALSCMCLQIACWGFASPFCSYWSGKERSWITIRNFRLWQIQTLTRRHSREKPSSPCWRLALALYCRCAYLHRSRDLICRLDWPPFLTVFFCLHVQQPWYRLDIIVLFFPTVCYSWIYNALW